MRALAYPQFHLATSLSFLPPAFIMFFFSSRGRHTIWPRDWSSDVCSSDLDVRNKLTSRGYMTISESKQHKQAHMVKSVVIIQSIKKIRTKRGESMAFLTLSDETEDIDGVVFPSLYRHVSRLLDVEKIVVINEKSEERNNRLQWLISTLQPFEYDTFIQSTKQLFIKLTNDNNVDALDKIRHIASQHPGTTPILIYHEMKNKTYKLAKQYQVDDGQACIQALKDIFGSEHVVLQT